MPEMWAIAINDPSVCKSVGQSLCHTVHAALLCSDV